MTRKNFCIVSIIFLLFAGCGERPNYTPTEMVEGVVTLDGVPVEGAEVTFYPTVSGIGESAMGKTDNKGHYRLSSMKGAPGKGTVAGEYGVTVSKWVTTKLDKPYIDKEQDALIEFESKELLPLVYTDIAYSPLRTSVVAGNNVIDLKLDSKAVRSR